MVSGATDLNFHSDLSDFISNTCYVPKTPLDEIISAIRAIAATVLASMTLPFGGPLAVITSLGIGLGTEASISCWAIPEAKPIIQAQIAPSAQTAMSIIPGWDEFCNRTSQKDPLITTGTVALGALAGASGVLPAGALAGIGVAVGGTRGDEAALGAGAFAITTATSSALTSIPANVGYISTYFGKDRVARKVQIATLAIFGTIASAAAVAGAAPGLAIGATASAISTLALAKTPLLFLGGNALAVASMGITWGWWTATQASSTALSVANYIPVAGPLIAPAIQTGKLAAMVGAGSVLNNFYNDPASHNKALTTIKRSWKTLKKDPLGTFSKLATETAAFAKESAQKGFEKAAEDTYTWSQEKFHTGFDWAKTWVEENGFDFLVQLPLYTARFASTALNFAVFSAPKIAYAGWQGLDARSRALLTLYYGALAYITFKPRPPLDIEFTSASLIPRTIRAISNGSTKMIQKGFDRLGAYTPIAKRINGSLFPKKPKAIFNEKLQKEIDDIAAAIHKAKTKDGFLAHLLLEGEPGTGKTMIGKAIAEQSGCHFVKMTGASLVNLIGSSTETIKRDKKGNVIERTYDARPQAKKLREILAFGQGEPHWFFWLPKKAWSLWANRIPTILFIDEIDLFLKDGKVLEKIDQNRADLLYTFLAKTGEPSKNLMIIGTTNRVQDMDTAAKSRFDSVLRIDPPGEKERLAIMEEHIDAAFPEYKYPERTTCLNKEGIATIAANTEHLTGRDLNQLAWRLHRARSQTENNRLTRDLIDETTRAFVERKRAISDNPAFKTPAKKSFFSRMTQAAG